QPAGVLERPPESGLEPERQYLLTCRKMTNALRDLSTGELADKNPERAFEHLAHILALSRTLRNKATFTSYLFGIRCEVSALEGLDQWLTQHKPSPLLLSQVLEELNWHASETPAPLDCVQAECLRTGGLLEFPTSWTFATGKGPGRVRERWLVGGISLSL